MKTKTLTLTILFASLYFVLVTIFHPISYGQIQIRIANMLLALIPIFGLPSVFGITLGVGIANLSSPLGLIDLLSIIPTLIGALIVWKLKNKSVVLGLSIYNIILSVWISFMLWFSFNVPYVITIVYVIIGLFIANVGLGYPSYRAIKRVVNENLWRVSSRR